MDPDTNGNVPPVTPDDNPPIKPDASAAISRRSDQKSAERRHHSVRWKFSMAAVATVVLATGIIRTQFVNTVTVSSDSMAPTICSGAVLLVARLDDGTSVKSGEIVTFTSPEDGAQTIKRVVGIAGQRVAIKDAELHIDGRIVDEPYVDHASIDGVYTATTVVPEGSVFVMGDHRETSIDSRVYGPIATSAVDGRLLWTLWSAC
jgi:signal peptidase I